jgi:hypothetical protein
VIIKLDVAKYITLNCRSAHFVTKSAIEMKLLWQQSPTVVNFLGNRNRIVVIQTILK